jgi:hypothetical protein
MAYTTLPYTTVEYTNSSLDTRAYFSAEFIIAGTIEFSIFVSTAAGYATLPTEIPPNQPFRGVLQTYSFSRSIVGSEIGPWIPGQGELSLSNADAFYDFLPREYTIDACTIQVKALTDQVPYQSAYKIANVIGTDWNINIDEVRINIRDFGYKLDVPMQTNIYLGTGEQEGGADLANKAKPLAFGTPHEITPPLVNATFLIYQVNDGAVQSIDAVYDRGVALTFSANFATYALLKAASISAGFYSTCTAQGYFRLGALGEFITCDVHGDNRDGYLDKTADLARWAIRNRTTLIDPTDLDTNTFAAVNTARPAPIEYWIGPDDTLTVADFISNIMGGILGWGGHRRDGKYEVRLFAAPTGTPEASFTTADIIFRHLGAGTCPMPGHSRPRPI